MKLSFLPFLLALFLFSACTPLPDQAAIETAKNEIMETEKAFAEMARTEGIPAAFLVYAAEDAVLSRNNSVIKGRSAIKAYFEAQNLEDVSLEWAPDFVEVASSGDLGYTYGPFTYTATDTSGNPVTAEGIFHTVWRKQADGKWLFVWD